jgi:hypothetical protein
MKAGLKRAGQQLFAYLNKNAYINCIKGIMNGRNYCFLSDVQ